MLRRQDKWFSTVFRLFFFRPDEASVDIQLALGFLSFHIKSSCRGLGVIFDPCSDFSVHISKLA